MNTVTIYDELRDELRSALFGDAETEEIVYRPSGGNPRHIRAHVDRTGEAALGRGSAQSPVLRVTVLNDTALGIGSAEINVGSDTVDVAERYGEEDKTRSIYRIAEHSGAHLVIEVR